MSHTAGDSFVITNKGPGTYPFTLLGGKYSFVATAVWNSDFVILNIIAPDHATAIQVTAASDDVIQAIDLPGGSFQFVVGGSVTAAYAGLFTIPG